MDEKTTRVFLVRHGETEWNAAQIFQGHLDSNLTEAGMEQARRLAERLEDERIVAIYSSDQGRAIRTAETVAGKLGLAVIPRADLREIDCGDWTGKQYDEVKAGWPNEHSDWRARPHLHRMPAGETAALVQERALGFLEWLGEKHLGSDVLVVTSNTVVRALVCHLLGWSLDKLWEGPKQSNCAVNLIEIRGGKPSLVLAGDVSHLEGVRVSTISFQQPPGSAV